MTADPTKELRKKLAICTRQLREAKAQIREQKKTIYTAQELMKSVHKLIAEYDKLIANVGMKPLYAEIVQRQTDEKTAESLVNSLLKEALQ